MEKLDLEVKRIIDVVSNHEVHIIHRDRVRWGNLEQKEMLNIFGKSWT